MRNRKLLLTASAVLALTMSLSGTVAYLSDTDDDVNNMTLGNVSIEQIEQERDGDGTLTGFTQDKPLMPAVYEGESIPYDNEDNWPVANDASWKVVQKNANVVDKFVTVKNDGKSDAYVRTLIAVEKDPKGLVHLVLNEEDWIWEKDAADIVVNGTAYSVYIATYKTILDNGETTKASLKQVYLDKTANNADLAGWGEKYDILVLSQAVQEAGFASAPQALEAGFPNGTDKTATIQGWFANLGADEGESEEPVTKVATLEDLKVALNKGGLVQLDAELTTSETITVPNGVTATLDLGEHTLTGTLAKGSAVLENQGKLTVKSGTVKSDTANGGYAIKNSGTLTITDAVVEGAPQNADAWPEYAVENTGMMTLNNVHIKSMHSGVSSTGEGALMTLNNCKLNVTGMHSMTYYGMNANNGGKIVVINGGTYEMTNTARKVINGTVEVRDGSFVGLVDDVNGNNPVITGGTFSVNPSSYVADGYQAIQNADGSWSVSAE